VFLVDLSQHQHSMELELDIIGKKILKI